MSKYSKKIKTSDHLFIMSIHGCNKCIKTYICMHTCMHTHTNTHAHTNAQIHMCTHTYTHTHTNTHTHTHTHTQKGNDKIIFILSGDQNHSFMLIITTRNCIISNDKITDVTPKNKSGDMFVVDRRDHLPGCGAGAILRPPNCHHCHHSSQASDVLPTQ